MAGISKILEVPEDNPLRFIRDDDPRRNYETYNGNFFGKMLQPWDLPQNYMQPWELTDYMAIQIYIGGLYVERQNLARIEIVDCKGVVQASIAPNYTGTMPGNRVEYNGVTFLMNTLNFGFNINQFPNITEGIYFVRIKVAYGAGATFAYDYSTSEPIHIRPVHFGTRLIEYISFSNKNNTHYRSGIFFHLRVPGDIIFNQPKANRIQYDDQQMNPRQQGVETYKLFLLKMGWRFGLPMWMYEKVNRAFANDLVKVDKTRYQAKAEIEITTRPKQWKMYGATLELQEYNQLEATISATKAPLELWNGATKPYMLYEGFLKNSVSGQRVNFWSGFEVKTLVEEDVMLSVFNSYAITIGLTGTFIRLGTIICKVNGENEYFDDKEISRFTKFVTFRYSRTIPTKNIHPYLRVSAKKASVVFDVHGEVYNVGVPPYTAFISNTFQKDYGAANNGTMRMYHEDTVEGFAEGYADYLLGEGTLFAVEDSIPNTLRFVDIANYKGSAFSMGNFPAATLQQVLVNFSTHLANITNFNKNWVALETINFDRSVIPTSNIDAIFNAHRNGGGYTLPANGVFRTKNQVPLAPPTAASLTARNALIAAGWNVITD